MTLAVAIGLGLLIGLTMGALGGGGSILTVPALVYALGESPRAATTGSLVIVGITAAAATLSHARSGQVRWRTGGAFAAAGIASSLAGTALNAHVNARILLVSFAILMLAAALAMLTKTMVHSHPEAAARDAEVEAEAVRGPNPGSLRSTTGLTAPVRPRIGTSMALRVTLAGLTVGFLTGFLGVGGGFVIVPALVLVLAYDMPSAVGTSLLIISLNSAVALAARSGGNTPLDWAVIAPFTAVAVVGSAGGKRIAARVSSSQLTRAFAVLLLLVAGYVMVRALLG